MACCGITKWGWSFPAIVLVGALFVVGAVTRNNTQADEKKESAKMLRHVVLFKFKETSSAEDVAKILKEFETLPSKIPQIAAFEWGTDNSPEGLADGFTHCFLITFKSEKDRDAYLPHEAHQAFVGVVKPHLEKVLVVDYWAK